MPDQSRLGSGDRGVFGENEAPRTRHPAERPLQRRA
jgi:hypothetical protein